MKRTNTAKWMEKYSRWQINVQKDGKRRTFTSAIPGRAGQREANAKADNWLENNIQDPNQKIDILLDKYLETVKSTTSACNYRKEKYHVDSFIRPEIGARRFHSITEQHFQDIINKAYSKTDPKTGETVYRSRKTLMNIRATIMAFLKFCRRRKATALFLEDLSIPKGARLKGKKILQPKELAILFRVDTTILNGKRVFDEYVYAYRYSVSTGLRPGELRGLKKSDIDGARVNVQRSINILDEETQGKNDNAVRGFTMSRLAQDALDAQLCIYPDGEFVFNIHSLSTFAHRWKTYCKSNGIEYISPYELRHTFISIVKTLPEGEIKPIVGHSRSMDTFGTYGHALSGEGDRTARQINEVFESLIGSEK